MGLLVIKTAVEDSYLTKLGTFCSCSEKLKQNIISRKLSKERHSFVRVPDASL